MNLNHATSMCLNRVTSTFVHRMARPLVTLALACLPLLLDAAQSFSEDPGSILSDVQIEQALQPPKTRSFVPRGLTRRDAADAQPSVNLNIPVEHDSSELKLGATAQLKQLATALDSASLRLDRFAVAGHTDAKCSPRYNQQLSLRRATAVKRYLVTRGIDPDRLDAIGHGSEHLLEPDRPEDPSNRRVEIRDLGRRPP